MGQNISAHSELKEFFGWKKNSWRWSPTSHCAKTKKTTTSFLLFLELLAKNEAEPKEVAKKLTGRLHEGSDTVGWFFVVFRIRFSRIFIYYLLIMIRILLVHKVVVIEMALTLSKFIYIAALIIKIHKLNWSLFIFFWDYGSHTMFIKFSWFKL